MPTSAESMNISATKLESQAAQLSMAQLYVVRQSQDRSFAIIVPSFRWSALVIKSRAVNNVSFWLNRRSDTTNLSAIAASG